MSNITEKIKELNPWFYKIELENDTILPGIYNDSKDYLEKNGPEALTYRQSCRKTLLVDEIVKRYNFEGKSLLDVACNCGYWSSYYIKDYGAKSLVGLEGRELFIKQAELLYDCLGIGDKANFYMTNVVDFDYSMFDDNEFDFILCSGILYHIKNQKELLEKLARINKDVMVVDTRVAKKEQEVFENNDLYFNAIEETRDRTTPAKSELVSTLKDLGYKVEKIDANFKIGKGLRASDNYHKGRRVTLFCQK